MSQTTDIATMNAVVREEILRQQARRRAKAALESTERTRQEDELRARIAALNIKYNRRESLPKRLLRRVADTWALYWAVWMNAPEIFLNWCEAKGWIEQVAEL